MAPLPLDLPEDENTWLNEVEAYYEKRGYVLSPLASCHSSQQQLSS